MMKKITVSLEDMDESSISIFVGGAFKTNLSSQKIGESIRSLGGEALLVPSKNGTLSLRYDDGWEGYQLFDNGKNLDEPFCESQVEAAIGKGFRKKPFTFYLREV